MDGLPNRPAPPHSFGQQIGAWLRWFGVARMLTGALAIAAVGAGGYWLLREPPRPVESTLPFATAGPTSTSVLAPTAVAPTSVTVAAAVVHVTGAVNAPGVYTLTPGARVVDALAAAGGPTDDADLESINLAAPADDGDRVFVPRVGQTAPTVVNPPIDSSTVGGPSPDRPVDLNNATVEMLDQLPGIGPATAAAIVERRERVGPFASIDDLLDVRGIGPAKLDAIRSLVTV